MIRASRPRGPNMSAWGFRSTLAIYRGRAIFHLRRTAYSTERKSSRVIRASAWPQAAPTAMVRGLNAYKREIARAAASGRRFLLKRYSRAHMAISAKMGGSFTKNSVSPVPSRLPISPSSHSTHIYPGG